MKPKHIKAVGRALFKDTVAEPFARRVYLELRSWRSQLQRTADSESVQRWIGPIRRAAARARGLRSELVVDDQSPFTTERSVRSEAQLAAIASSVIHLERLLDEIRTMVMGRNEEALRGLAGTVSEQRELLENIRLSLLERYDVRLAALVSAVMHQEKLIDELRLSFIAMETTLTAERPAVDIPLARRTKYSR